MNYRQIFIIDFFSYLKDLDYVMLKCIEENIQSIGEYSDIDLALNKNQREHILKYFDNYKNISQYKVYSYTFMDMIFIVFNDNSFLAVDLIYKFMRKNLCYLDTNELLTNSNLNFEGIKISSPRYNFLYIFLFYLLNKTDINIKYKNHFAKLPEMQKKDILNFINKRYRIRLKSFNDLNIFDIELYRSVKKSLESSNTFFSKIKNRVLYLKNINTNLIKSKIITFSGVDGAGKTTILRNFSELLEKKYRRNVVELRHRPSILPILSSIKYGKKEAEKKTTEVLPRSGRNNSKLSSYIRFFYYLTDYVLGQWIVFLKHSLRGDIVIYDRYYFDFINDARRTNINIDSNFVKFFYNLIFKPDINIFLFAPPEVILSRKQEMDKDSIVLLTEKYQILFKELLDGNPDQYVSIKNIEKNETLKIIEKLYIKTSL